MAVSGGQGEALKHLQTPGVNISGIDQNGHCTVYWAACEGHTDVIRRLVEAGVCVNTQNQSGETAVHAAAKGGHTAIVELLCAAGADVNIGNSEMEIALHCAAARGNLDCVKVLLEFRASLDVINQAGLTAFHLACRAGHAEVVRCLLLAGADSEILNKDGLTGEILALAQGFIHISEMVAHCKGENRLELINQLKPLAEPISRVKLKLLGSSGVGKSTLVESLKAGLLGSLYKRKSASSAPKHKMSRQHYHQFSLPSPLSYQLRNPAYTRGIDIQSVSITGAGDFTVWEFSGYEPYYVFYDDFLGDVDCIHAVIFSIEDSLEEQMAQVVFWLNFLKSRMKIKLPLEFCGKPKQTAQVVMVATKADKSSIPCYKTSSGHYTNKDCTHILDKVRTMFQHDLHICPTVYLMNTQQPSSADMKALKQQLCKMKQKLLKRVETTTGLLSAVVSVMPEWQQTFHTYPVLSWPEFVEQIHSCVNPLADETDIKVLDLQLQQMGEIIHLQGCSDLIVVNPQWLATDVLGGLLSHERIMMSKITGWFSLNELQLMFPDTDADSLLQVFEALDLCTLCEVDGDVKYEFPCLNFEEALPGLWLKGSTGEVSFSYGGVRLHTSVESGSQLKYLFPRIQVHLRRSIISRNERKLQESYDNDVKTREEDNGADLCQWHHGSKYCCDSLEGILDMDKKEQYLEIKVRGPTDQRANLHYFLHDLINITERVVAGVCPGLPVVRNILSPSQLKEHSKVVRSYSPTELHRMQLDGRSSVVLSGDLKEDFKDIACFGSARILKTVTLGMDLPCSHLTIHCQRLLSLLLDAPESMGKDWCLLAVTLELNDFLPAIEAAQAGKRHRTSPTLKVLNEWARRHPNASIRHLVGHLKEIGRLDAVEAILRTTPSFKVISRNDHLTEDVKHTSERHSSVDTLSVLSRHHRADIAASSSTCFKKL